VSGRKPLRQRVARNLMVLAARIDNRPNVTYAISHHHPPAWRTSAVGGPGGGGGRGGAWLLGHGGDGRAATGWPMTTVTIPDRPNPKPKF
jgi:hypothetical protein